MLKKRTGIAIIIACFFLMIAYECLIGDILFSSVDYTVRTLVDLIITRALGAIALTVLVAYLGFRVLNPVRPTFWKSAVFCLPAFAVAINNFPFSCLIKGDAVVDAGVGRVVLLAFECIAVALFEEMAFRGVVLLGFSEKAKSRLGLFLAIILSSAVFGVIHLLNLFTSSPIVVIMQIGYSFLIGGMCSVILLKTKNIWFCVAIHAIFNFGGAIVSTLGHGEIWDTFTVIFTAILAVATFVYMLVAFFMLDISSVGEIYDR